MADRPNPSAPQPPPSSSAASLRLPPPCWSHDETVALIDAYREKWYSLRRGNLKAFHWQEVAEGVAERCAPSAGCPQKTSVQCRHKMEKLRKRYRGEMQRAAATAGRHRTSAWVHFNRMDFMEKDSTSVVVPLNTAPIDVDDEEEDSDEEYQEKFYPKKGKNGASHSRMSMSNGINGNGVHIRFPSSRSKMASPPPTAEAYSEFDEFSTPSPNPITNFGTSKNFKDKYIGRFGIGKGGGVSETVRKKRENDPSAELVAAIKGLGDGFVRMERMKMEMARKVEAMRMDMEMKRTQMILESQQRMVESLVKAITESKNKKAKRMPSPES